MSENFYKLFNTGLFVLSAFHSITTSGGTIKSVSLLSRRQDAGSVGVETANSIRLTLMKNVNGTIPTRCFIRHCEYVQEINDCEEMNSSKLTRSIRFTINMGYIVNCGHIFTHTVAINILYVKTTNILDKS